SSSNTLSNSTISYCGSIGLRVSATSTTWTITGNIVDSIGHIAGMGGSGEGQYMGVRIDIDDNNGNNDIITQNNFTNVGYIPLGWNGQNVLIQYNFVNNYGFVKDDAGGIYCDQKNMTGSKILDNIVINGIGAPDGHLDYRCFGIYVDDAANN